MSFCRIVLSTVMLGLVCGAASAPAWSCTTPSGGAVPLAQHVILVIEENTSFSNAFSGMPWLVGQAQTKGGYSASGCYNTDANGSLLEYLMLSSGSLETQFGCNGNDCTSQITDNSVYAISDNLPQTWKVYAETYQNAGGYVTAPDNSPGGVTHYYRRHNPATWYQEIFPNNHLGSQGRVVDFEQFWIDVANGTLPRYSIIIPDGLSDAHDGTIGAADNFLKNNLDVAGIYTDLLTLPDFQPGGSGLLIVTFDNGNSDAAGPVLTTLIGPNVKQGYVSNFSYKHENTLRTVLDALGITTYPGLSASAADMADFFSTTAGSVVINSPANGSFQGPAVLVNAAARELSSTIDHMEVWDNGTKLGNVFSNSINQVFNVTGNGAHQMTVQDIGPGPNFPILHKLVTNYTVSATDGVFVTAPAASTNQGELFPVEAYSVESTADIVRMEVWADGHKVGDSPLGSSISQWYSDKLFSMLSPGSHQLTIQDVASGDVVLHKVTIPITVAAQNNVYVNSPANNSTQGTNVLVNAYAWEQSGGSTQQVARLEVWDIFNGTSTKLGNSPLGYAGTSLFINQTYTLQPGSHQLVVQDISTSNAIIHKVTLNITVQ